MSGFRKYAAQTPSLWDLGFLIKLEADTSARGAGPPGSQKKLVSLGTKEKQSEG